MSIKQVELFPLTDAFVVTTRGLLVKDEQVSQDDWARALREAARRRSAVQWVIGDLLLYADQRQFEDGLVEATMEATGFKRGTILNLKSVAKAFPQSRRSSLSWSHHALVAGFSESDRAELLKRAKANNLSWEELRAVTKELRHALRVEAMEFPTGTYGLIMADPPWTYEEGAVDPTRQIENQYPVMPTDQICALAPKVQGITAPSAVLYLWATGAKVVSGEAADVIKAWGFNGRSSMVWVKQSQGMGYWARQRHEFLLIATRGNPVPPEESVRPDSIITANRGLHSQKPTEAYEMLERCYPSIPKVELFAREPREGWVSWGNELLERQAEATRGLRLREESMEMPA